MNTDKADDVSAEPVDHGPPPPISHNIMVVKDLKSMQARRSLNRHSLCGLNQVVGTLTWTIKISCLGFGPPLELLHILFRQCHHFSCQLSEFGPDGTVDLCIFDQPSGKAEATGISALDTDCPSSITAWKYF